jgi:hypothetical protein
MKMLINLLIFIAFGTINAQNFQVDTLFMNGSVDARINIVILGDGYLESELPDFDKHANNFINYMFTDRPFREYKSYFNAFAIRVPSNVSGAAMNPQNLIDNYFGSTFGSGGIDRLLVPTRSSKVMSVLADNFPQYDQVIMLVNSTKYGGSGGWVATSSVHQSAGEVVLHEIGHSFAGLADEYYAGDQYAREKANMTRETSPEKVKWKNWYGDKGVGIYQHCCGGKSAEWYKPHENCKMRSLSKEFCSVCLETIIARIHKLTNAIELYSPTSTTLEPDNYPIIFELQLISPEPNSLKIEWLVNSNIYEINNSQISLQQSDLLDGNNTIAVYVKDTTEFIRISDYENINVNAVLWTLNNDMTDVEYINSEQYKINVSIFPNPTSDFLWLKFGEIPTRNLQINLQDIMGRNLQSINTQDLQSNDIMFDLSEYADAVYLLSIVENGYPVIVKKIIKK